MNQSMKKLVKTAVLCALSIVLVMLVHFPLLPGASFLEYDPADIPLLMVSLMYGPWYGLAATVIVSVIQGLTVSAASGIVGILMHIIATGTLVIVTGLIFRKKGKLIPALAFGSIAMILMMIPSNLFFTVKFWGTPFNAVVAMLPTTIIPFNAIKAVLNSVVAGILYAKLGKTKLLS